MVGRHTEGGGTNPDGTPKQATAGGADSGATPEQLAADVEITLPEAAASVAADAPAPVRTNGQEISAAEFERLVAEQNTSQATQPQQQQMQQANAGGAGSKAALERAAKQAESHYKSLDDGLRVHKAKSPVSEEDVVKTKPTFFTQLLYQMRPEANRARFAQSEGIPYRQSFLETYGKHRVEGANLRVDLFEAKVNYHNACIDAGLEGKILAPNQGGGTKYVKDKLDFNEADFLGHKSIVGKVHPSELEHMHPTLRKVDPAELGKKGQLKEIDGVFDPARVYSGDGKSLNLSRNSDLTAIAKDLKINLDSLSVKKVAAELSLWVVPVIPAIRIIANGKNVGTGVAIIGTAWLGGAALEEKADNVVAQKTGMVGKDEFDLGEAAKNLSPFQTTAPWINGSHTTIGILNNSKTVIPDLLGSDKKDLTIDIPMEGSSQQEILARRRADIEKAKVEDGEQKPTLQQQIIERRQAEKTSSPSDLPPKDGGRTR